MAAIEGEGGEEISARDEEELDGVEFLGLRLEGCLFSDLEGEQVGGTRRALL